MRKGLVIFVLLAVAALVGVSQAQRSDATFHLMRVYGVMGGASGDAQVQFVELRMAAGLQNFVSGSYLCFYDATGSPYARFVFTSNVPSGTAGSSILIGTSEFDATWAAGAPDFLFSGANTVAIAGGADIAHPVRSPGGKVSFGTDTATIPAQMCQGGFVVIDSVAYGSGYSGSVDFGMKFASDLPTSGTDAVRLQGPVCFLACTRLNSTDYAITDVNTSGNNPRNNAGVAGSVGGAGATFDVLKDFVPDSGASVTVSLSCASGAVTPASASASEATPATFTVTGFTGDPDCTATESPVPTNYLSSGTCVAALVAVGQCTITNNLDCLSLPPWPVPAGDTDCDGSVTGDANSGEVFFGTDPADACSDTATLFDERGSAFGEPEPAWPPDINDDQVADFGDILAFAPHFNKTFPDPDYSARFDFFTDGTVDFGDILFEYPTYFNKNCTNYFAPLP